jgi:uncharacterized protein YqfB (UPF0267 family)
LVFYATRQTGAGDPVDVGPKTMTAYDKALRDFRVGYFLRAVDAAGGNMCQAAGDIGVHRNTISRVLGAAGYRSTRIHEMLKHHNFQKRFAPKILSGEKRHTIRAKRKRATKPGELLHLYTGLRQKGAQLLMRPRCTKIKGIYIDLIFGRHCIYVDRVKLSRDECDRLAQADGFFDFAEMMKFWAGRLPFEGDIIHWHFPPESQSSRENEPCANVSAQDAKQYSRATIATAHQNAEKRQETMTGARSAKRSNPARSVAPHVDSARSTLR